MNRPTLYIGNKNYSSWSLRPWLALRWARVDFDERVIALGGEGYGRGEIPEVRAVSPTGRVPVLVVGARTVWDSLAICEWANEEAQGALWPDDRGDRAEARSVVAEMHAGFASVRRDLSMNIRRRAKVRRWPDDTMRELARLEQLFSSLRAAHREKGPFLFGRRSIVDAFYTPVATRLRTYGVSLSETADAYAQTLLDDEDFLAWERAAVAEPYRIEQTDALYPES